MNALREHLVSLMEDKPYKLVVNKPVGGDGFRKIVLTQKKGYYQAEQFTQKQVFHKNLREDELVSYLADLLSGRYLQLAAWSGKAEYSLRVTKRGKLLFHKGKTQGNAPPAAAEHNRQKNYLLKEGEVIPPLIDMGVFTREGAVVRSMYGKYRQINRFVELVDDAVKAFGGKKLHILDFGCGKSYLTFVLYYFLTEVRGIEVEMVGLDLKEDVIARCNETARKYGYSGLRFELGNIDGYRAGMPVDMVVTLHACDTATDFALFNAVSWGAKMIFSVPCCQHELAAQMSGEGQGIFTRYGIVKERTAALLTDAIRANLLTCCGYQTGLMEFVELEHTPKNLLIRAVKGQVPLKQRREAFEEVKNACGLFSFSPILLRMLTEAGVLEELAASMEAEPADGDSRP